MTRKQMEAVLKDGGSVMLPYGTITRTGNRLVTSLDELPHAEDLATSESERSAAKSDLESQIKQLSARLDKIGNPTPVSESKGSVKAANVPAPLDPEGFAAAYRDMNDADRERLHALIESQGTPVSPDANQTPATSEEPATAKKASGK